MKDQNNQNHKSQEAILETHEGSTSRIVLAGYENVYKVDHDGIIYYTTLQKDRHGRPIYIEPTPASGEG